MTTRGAGVHWVAPTKATVGLNGLPAAGDVCSVSITLSDSPIWLACLLISLSSRAVARSCLSQGSPRSMRLTSSQNVGAGGLGMKADGHACSLLTPQQGLPQR